MKLIGLAALVLLLVGACGTLDEPKATAPTTSTVKYEVTGDLERTSITISTPSGTSQQSTAVPIVNKGGGEGLVFTMPAGSFAYIAAQNNDDDSYGPITCTITIDGVKVSENTSSGQFSIATCKARA